ANAEEIFDLLTGTYGASGEFAAGVLSNVKQESGFIPDRAEGIGELKFGMDNKNMPGGGGPGGGLFQFTPHTKYTNGKFGNETHISGASKGSDYWGANGGDGWDIENQVDRKSTRLNSSHVSISYAVFCLKKKIRNRDLTKHRQRAHVINPR